MGKIKKFFKKVKKGTKKAIKPVIATVAGAAVGFVIGGPAGAIAGGTASLVSSLKHPGSVTVHTPPIAIYTPESRQIHKPPEKYEEINIDSVNTYSIMDSIMDSVTDPIMDSITDSKHEEINVRNEINNEINNNEIKSEKSKGFWDYVGDAFEKITHVLSYEHKIMDDIEIHAGDSNEIKMLKIRINDLIDRVNDWQDKPPAVNLIEAEELKRLLKELEQKNKSVVCPCAGKDKQCKYCFGNGIMALNAY